MMAEDRVLIQKNFMKISLFLQQVAFPRILLKKLLLKAKKHTQKLFLTKLLTNKKKCITFRFVKGTKPMTGCRKASAGPRDSDSLLHSLSSGPWTLKTLFRMPISFSPFLPFGAFETPPGQPGGVFLFCYIKNTADKRPP